jgi:hypothetical protein
MIHDFNSKPDFTNDEGTKFWLDASINRYAKTPDANGTTLDNVKCLIVETKTGHRTRLLFDGEECVADLQSLEAMASRIDLMKYDKRTRNLSALSDMVSDRDVW